MEAKYGDGVIEYRIDFEDPMTLIEQIQDNIWKVSGLSGDIHTIEIVR